MFAAALLLGALPRLRLVPVDPDHANGIFLVSDDGNALFSYAGGVMRYNRRKDKGEIGPEVLRVACFDDGRIVSRTTSQDLNATVGPPSQLTEVRLYAAASDYDHILVATWGAITEFGFRDRQKNPNQNWALPTQEGRLACLRYGPQGTVEAWMWNRTLDGLLFTRYEGLLARPQAGLRRTGKVRAHLPRAELSKRLGPVGYDPNAETYVLGVGWGGAEPVRLLDRSGRVLRRVPHRDSTATVSLDAPLEWALRPPRSVPGGPPAWTPLSVSGNRKAWLLRRNRDGRTFILRI